MFEKSIYGQDGYYKLSAKKSGETSINLSNEIANYIKSNSNREQIISFTIYLEDFYKALGYIANKLPLFVSTSKSSSEEMYSDAFFQKTFATINAFFGGESEKLYQVNLLSREDGRFYLNRLEYNGFNVRKFLIAGHSKLIFDKINDKLVLRLVSGDLSDGEESTTSSTPLSTLNPASLTSFNQQLLSAIRTKPFVLLAGISGTGKSRIVRELAKACWPDDEEQRNAQEPKNFMMIQVRPNWHDSTELIGYVSRINGEKYIAGDFIKFVARAWQDPERPYFLCLDEMNLAPVEQYFAEYLSIIESRKYNKDKGLMMTDCIVRFDKKSAEEWTDCYKKLYDELFGNCPPESELYVNEHIVDGISIPQNLIVIGTVNMDETTYSFSRKVLDRAMTLEMNEVDMWGGLVDDESFNFGNLEDILANAVSDEKVAYQQDKDLCDKVLEYLENVNSKLEGTPFKIAYRTRNEFLMYALNRKSLAKDGEDVYIKTIDEMTSMKILSRIEGDFEKTSRVLSDIKKILENQSLAIDNSISLKKIDEMDRKLKSGYTSYWA